MRTIPLLLSLPDGPARLVPGSFEQGRPRYERDGAPLDVDVTIPDDMEVAGWFWHGSFLCKPGEVGLAICTKTFGVPGVFDNARELERLRVAWDATPAPAKKRRKRESATSRHAAPECYAPEPSRPVLTEQLGMELFDAQP